MTKLKRFKKFCKKYLVWKYLYRFLRIIEVIGIVIAALVIIEVPKQINDWTNSQSNRTFDQLIKLSDILNQGTNRKIAFAIDNKDKILVSNGGKFSEDDLNNYLSDLYSIYDAYNRDIISRDDTYSWFSDILTKTVNNKEISEHMNKIRNLDPEYYGGFEEFVKEIGSK